MISSRKLLLGTIVCTFFITIVSSLKEGDCEVCIATINKFVDTLSDDVKKDPKKIEDQFRKYCKNSKGKENRFCYYLGGLEESATGTLGDMSKPVSYHMPADKICEKLKKKDAQICDLRFDKQIDLNAVDLKKLKVRDLKKILSDWDETCDGCLEKPDFIKRIEELKPKYQGGAAPKKEL